MDGDGLYPASEAKLRKLREAGVVPISSNLLSAAACFGALFFALAAKSYLGTELSRLAAEAGQAKPVQLSQVLQTTAVMLLSGCAAVVLPIILLSLIQSRFLFSIRRLWGRTSRRPSFHSAGGELFHLLIWFALFTLGSIAAIRTFISGGAGIHLQPFELEVLNSLLIREILLFADSALKVLAFFSLIALFYGLISWFVLVLWFRRSHRMTREELEAEYRETEMSPELRRVFGERALGERGQ